MQKQILKWAWAEYSPKYALRDPKMKTILWRGIPQTCSPMGRGRDSRFPYSNSIILSILPSPPSLNANPRSAQRCLSVSHTMKCAVLKIVTFKFVVLCLMCQELKNYTKMSTSCSVETPTVSKFRYLFCQYRQHAESFVDRPTCSLYRFLKKYIWNLYRRFIETFHAD